MQFQAQNIIFDLKTLKNESAMVEFSMYQGIMVELIYQLIINEAVCYKVILD